MQVPNNPTTQALGEAGAVSGAVASTIAVAAPAPWGQIVAGILGAFSVIAGIIAHSAASKNSAQQIAAAVTTGLQAAAQSLAPTAVSKG
jgi:fluoride ion exporter CrcB/FEX